jgi:shikimate kinase
MKSTIILIGPMCAGKSTQAQLLSKSLDIPRIELDQVRQSFYDELGYDEKFASELVEKEGMRGLIKYWKPYEAYAVERVLEEYDRCVIDFGAGHSVYEDPELFSRVEQALKPYPNVILIIPSPDIDQSVEIVNQRFTELQLNEVGGVDPELLELNEHFVRHSSNSNLAKKIIYTAGKSSDEINQDIVSWIVSEGSGDFSLNYNQGRLF